MDISQDAHYENKKKSHGELTYSDFYIKMGKLKT